MAETSEFFLELPELTFDPRELLKIAEEMHDHWKPYVDPGYNSIGASLHLRHPTNVERAYVQHLRKKLTFVINRHRVMFFRILPGVLVPPHLDLHPPGMAVARQAAIVFPLIPKGPKTGAPIRWHRDGKVVMEHHYSTEYATMINTQQTHSVQNNEHERIAFQFSVYEQFADCVTRYREGTFFTNSLHQPYVPNV
jgi:hypothetical protein